MSKSSSSGLPEGTVTFLFTDIEGSTTLLKRLQAEYVGLLIDHHRILRDVFNSWNGHEMGTEGDSFFVSFRRATDALNAAVEIQRSLASHRWPGDVEVRVRMGLHTGEPLSDVTVGYAGIDVHRVARIANIGHGGQVLLSETTSALVRDELPTGVHLVDMGRQKLKDFDRPEQIRQLVIEGLLRNFPPLTSIEAADESKAKEEGGELPTLDLAASANRQSIVVLPFVNMSPDGENEYFSDGLTEEVIADLAKIHDLKVISRTSAMMFKESTKDSRTIGRELNVRYLLEGSVRTAGQNLRITAQLIDTFDDTHLWAEKYAGTFEDVFEIQESLSRKIVDALKITLSPTEKRLVTKVSVSDDAHQAYLRGRYLLNMITPDSVQEAIGYFEEAVGLEPDYALAYASLATCYGYLGWLGVRLIDVVPRAKDAAVKALSIDDMSAEAHNGLGYTAIQYDWDWPKAQYHLEQALALNPNSSQAWLHYHWYLLSQSRYEECRAAIRRASELDPLSIIIQMNQPNYYQGIGDYDTMLRLALSTLEVAPFAITALLNAGWASLSLARYDHAIEHFEKIVALAGAGAKGHLGYAYGVAGLTERSRAILNSIENPPQGEYERPMQIALVHMGLRQYDQAFDWLDRTYTEHASPLMPFVRQLPMFDRVRDDARYLDLVRRLKFQG